MMHSRVKYEGGYDAPNVFFTDICMMLDATGLQNGRNSG